MDITVPAPKAGRAQIEDQGIDLLQLARAVLRGKWLTLALTGLCALIGIFYAFRVATPIYAATSKIIMEIGGPQIVNLESVVSGLSTEQAAINTEIEVIVSQAVMQRVVQDLGLAEVAEFNPALAEASVFSPAAAKEWLRGIFADSEDVVLPRPADEAAMAARLLRDNVQVWVQRNTYIFNIRAQSTDPERAGAIANAVARIYIEEQISGKLGKINFAVQWLSERAAELGEDLRRKEDAIKAFRAGTSFVSPEALEVLNGRVSSQTERLKMLQRNAEQLEVRAKDLQMYLESGDMDAILDGLPNDPVLRRLSQAGGSDAALSAGTRDAIRTRAERLLLDAEEEQTRLVSQIDALEVSLGDVQREIETQSESLIELTQLERDAESTKVLYETFLTRLKETSIQMGLQQSDSAVLTEASTGQYMSPNKIGIVVMAAMLGAALGMAVSIVLELRQNSFRSSEELERATGFSVIGQVPSLPSRDRGDLIEYLINNPTSAMVEAVRNLRTSILMSDVDPPPKVIMSTSSVPGEGKTTIAIAMAQNLAGLGKKVLLVEGDIRRCTMDQYFSRSAAGDIVSLLSKETDLNESLIYDDRLGVDVLLGAKTSINAADLFASEAFAHLLSVLRNHYDLIIIDMPPVVVVPDARVAAKLCDAVIYAVHWGETPRSVVLEGLRQFTSVGIRPTGLVMSQVDARKGRYYGHYGSQYGSGYYNT